MRVGDQVASIGNANGLGCLAISAGPIIHLNRGIASTADSDPNAEPMTGLIEARSRSVESAGWGMPCRTSMMG